MSIPQRQKKEFEQITTSDFVKGEIIEVQEDLEHKFTFKGNETIAPAVRFIFMLDDYNDKHYSRWMKFIYAEKSTLYSKYLTSLVEGIEPFSDFDIQNLKGAKVKILWKNDGDSGWQSIETIRPVGAKVKYSAGEVEPDIASEVDKLAQEPEEENLPF